MRPLVGKRVRAGMLPRGDQGQFKNWVLVPAADSSE